MLACAGNAPAHARVVCRAAAVAGGPVAREERLHGVVAEVLRRDQRGPRLDDQALVRRQVERAREIQAGGGEHDVAAALAGRHGSVDGGRVLGLHGHMDT